MRTILLAAALLSGATSSVAASLTHDYLFQNTLADSLGGPSLVSLGGTLGAGHYTFGAEQGLSLSGALAGTDNANYSIFLNFELDTLAGFRKILDFKNLASDDGLYNLSTALNYFNFTTGPAGAFTPGTFAQLVLTRDSTGKVVGYVNGVQQITFNDSTSDAVFNAAGNIMNFFQDDNVTGGRESSSGEVSEIRLYSGALTAAEVAGLVNTPEPASVALGCAGLLFFAFGRRRKRFQ